MIMNNASSIAQMSGQNAELLRTRRSSPRDRRCRREEYDRIDFAARRSNPVGGIVSA